MTRDEMLKAYPNLSGANLSKADLREINLSKANLSQANLSRADLRWTNLSKANLSQANLSRADLRETNLSHANLIGANLNWADLRETNLSEANLIGANLNWADLRETNLSEANLSKADFRGANLSLAMLYNTDLCETNLPPFQIPQEGELIVYKKLKSHQIAKLRVPPEAKRTATLVSRKCRAEFVEVLECAPDVDLHTGLVEYQTGWIIKADSYDDDIRIECSHGIHFFLTRKEAEDY